MTELKSYKDTVNLPKTKFDMRANAVKREPELQQFWADQHIYDRLSQNNPGELFILHDGPPYANGQLHIGHALNKILKDTINRYQMLQGRKVRYVPGWDCHGLPIELKVLQDMKPALRQKLTTIELRRQARDFAIATMEQQREGFKRYGIWGNWEHPYLTLKPEYEAAQIGVFAQMVLKGYIYRGMKPVHWSPSSKTALAEAELEYPEGHTSRSIYVALAIAKLAKSAKALTPYLPNLHLAVWTTTPWTIPANLAVAVNPDLTYAVVKFSGEGLSTNGAQNSPESEELSAIELKKTPENKELSTKVEKTLIVAADLVEKLSATFNTKLEVLATIQGKDLEKSTYKHPLFDRISPVVIGGDYITADSGTGLVHTAPGHGQEDYQVGQRYGLPLLSPVDDNGNFTAEAGQFEGLNVLGDGNGAVIDALAGAGALIKEEVYAHSYPYDWRTKKPTIFRATEQWFASVEGFREAALKAIADVKWIPAQGENRITAMVSDRSDWCISRQRSWGVPIPAFYDEETGEPLLNEETIAHVQAIVAQKGSDAWWELPIEELLPESYRNNGKTYRKGTDTMDVWFDSGSSWAAVAKGREELHYPAEMYLEGSDQHRGWFQSSLLTSVANNGIAPYKTVLTHGFVLDEQGRKMSKSLGNVVDPAVVINEYGADVLRLWVSSVDYSADVPLGKNILKQQADVYRKIRNTARFLLGNLHDFDPAKNAVSYQELPELDRYMLHRMTEVFAEVKDAFDSFQFFRFFQTVQNFCVVDLSNFYLDIAKDRLYISAEDSLRRRSCQTVLAIAVESLARAIAPVLCHLAEDIWQYIPYPTAYKSVFEAGWVQIDNRWHNPELGKSWEYLRQVRGEVNKVLELARSEKAIGAPLEAKVLLYVPDAEKREKLQALNPSTEGLAAKYMHPHIEDEKSIELEKEVSVEHAETGTDNTVDLANSESQQSFIEPREIVEKVTEFISDLPRFLGQFLAENQQAAVTVILLFAVFAVAKAIGAVLDTVNQIPLLGETFELIGFGYAIWFVWQHLLFAANRQELSEKVETLKVEVLGKEARETTVEAKAIASQPEEIKVEVPAISNTAEIVSQLSAVKKPASAIKKLHDSATGNGVDELRYLLIASQVELLESSEGLEGIPYSFNSEDLGVGVVKADGQKCDRCWNYSTHVGESEEHPLLCERCVPALAGQF
ncbi:isoleucine--tRNA ligase [Kamptonema animale CS-326]|uniref:isoleucine--tRNA ligase n=1 Tax=Kamptonema animale TaxID=92934 RepID=UPI002330D6E3|nr:isoleucine--tRNA ligase [Kamptonema animale]MDB9510594.1 isoleucine--tRNA ligase [Kamptonema animale CS-326]